MTYAAIVSRISGHYLSEPLPSNWSDMDEPVLLDFIAVNAWAPFENWEPYELLNTIEASALDMINFFDVELSND